MSSTGRLGWFLFGAVLGIVMLELYDGLAAFAPGWLRGVSLLVRFAIQLVAWVGVMLAVVGALGWRLVRKDQMNYLFVGFGAIIVTLELLLAIPYGLV